MHEVPIRRGTARRLGITTPEPPVPSPWDGWAVSMQDAVRNLQANLDWVRLTGSRPPQVVFAGGTVRALVADPDRLPALLSDGGWLEFPHGDHSGPVDRTEEAQ